MHSLRIRLAAIAVALTLVLLSITSPTGVAHSASPYLAHITGTGIGLMFRTNPNDWNSRGGPAGYDGDVAMLQCEVMGTPVGQYSNRAWYTATTRFGSGWIPDHFLDTPIQANQWLPGLPSCQTSIPAPIPSGTSVFFSPNEIPSGITNLNFNDPTIVEVPLSQWALGGCSDTAVRQKVPLTATTLVGWSLSRLAPIYFLAANRDRWNQIHTIVLFDPGSTNEMATLSLLDRLRGMKSPCDLSYDINSLLAGWLQSSPQNQLVVFTGRDSERNKFGGLWTYYFAGIWNQPFANQALVCDYNGMQHPDVLQNFAGYVGDLLLEPMISCPPSPDGAHFPRTQWNP